MQLIKQLSNSEAETGLAGMNDWSSIFAAFGRSLGGILEAVWRQLKASWRRHYEVEVRLMV